MQGLDRIFKHEQRVKKESDLYRRNKGLGEPNFDTPVRDFFRQSRCFARLTSRLARCSSCVGSGFGAGAGIRFRPPKQPWPPPFRLASQQRCSAVVAVRPFDEATRQPSTGSTHRHSFIFSAVSVSSQRETFFFRGDSQRGNRRLKGA